MKSFEEALKEAEPRFWSKVNKNNGTECFLWTGSINHLGYGCFRFLRKNHRSHRISWMIETGKLVPEGMSVLHKCDVRNCVNPKHLFLGTQDDNMKDAARKGRIVSPGSHGEDNPMAKLTEKDVLELRRLRKEQNLSCYKLAKIFEVAPMTAYRAYTKQSWKKTKEGD